MSIQEVGHSYQLKLADGDGSGQKAGSVVLEEMGLIRIPEIMLQDPPALRIVETTKTFKTLPLDDLL